MEMRFKNEADSWSPWEPYDTIKIWELSSGEGVKTVWVIFRDAGLYETNPINDSILLIATTTTFLNETGVNIQNFTTTIGIYIELNISDICFLDVQKQSQKFAEVEEPSQFRPYYYYLFELYGKNFIINNSIIVNATIRIFYSPGDVVHIQKLALLKYMGGGIWIEMDIIINSMENYIEFSTSSFSYYVLGEKKYAAPYHEDPPAAVPPADNFFFIIIIIIIGAVAIISSGGAYAVRKNKILKPSSENIKAQSEGAQDIGATVVSTATTEAARKRERLMSTEFKVAEEISSKPISPTEIAKEKIGHSQVDLHKKPSAPVDPKKAKKSPSAAESSSTPIITEAEQKEIERTESEVDVEKSDFICVVHKGSIDGAVYICPRCKTFYCVKCASALRDKGENCWSCETPFKITIS